MKIKNIHHPPKSTAPFASAIELPPFLDCDPHGPGNIVSGHPACTGGVWILEAVTLPYYAIMSLSVNKGDN